jgi:hypothetical protein
MAHATKSSEATSEGSVIWLKLRFLPPEGVGSHNDITQNMTDTQIVISRLEDAGATLQALHGTSRWPTVSPNPVFAIARVALAEDCWAEMRTRLPIPPETSIDRMIETHTWLEFIPADQYAIRRLVVMRSLLHPVTQRHLFPWNQLASRFHTNRKGIQAQHAKGIDMIVAALLAAA